MRRLWPVALLVVCMPLASGAAEFAPGVGLDLGYLGEVVRNFQPGVASPTRRTIYQDHLDLALTLDLVAMGGPDMSVFVHGVRDHGADPTAQVIGDLQTASNIEAPDQMVLYEAWVEWRFGDGIISMLAGLHDLNSEFDVSEYASLFLNSSFGIGPEISANVPVSIFPKPGWGVVARVQDSLGDVVRIGLYDGDPETRTIRPKTEGLMGIGELELHWSDMGEPGMIKLGWWRHTADHSSPFIPGQVAHGVSGAYAILEQRFVHWNGGGLGLFVQYGQAQRRRTAVPRYMGIGLHLQGFLPARPEDEIGLGMARAEFQRALGAISAETAIEIVARLVFADGRLALHPSWQHIVHVGGLPNAPSVDVGLLRVELAF